MHLTDGARRLRDWILQPLRDLEALRARQDLVESLMGAPFILAKIRESLKGIRDIERGEEIHIPRRDISEPVFGLPLAAVPSDPMVLPDYWADHPLFHTGAAVDQVTVMRSSITRTWPPLLSSMTLSTLWPTCSITPP